MTALCIKLSGYWLLHIRFTFQTHFTIGYEQIKTQRWSMWQPTNFTNWRVSTQRLPEKNIGLSSLSGLGLLLAPQSGCLNPRAVLVFSYVIFPLVFTLRLSVIIIIITIIIIIIILFLKRFSMLNVLNCTVQCQ